MQLKQRKAPVPSRLRAPQRDGLAVFWKKLQRLREPDHPPAFEFQVLALILIRALSESSWPGPRTSSFSKSLHDPARWAKLLDAALSFDGRTRVKAALVEISGLLNLPADSACDVELSESRLRELLVLINEAGQDSELLLCDALTEVFDHCLRGFANAEPQIASERTTPACIAALMVQLAQPEQGTVYDPCCGTGGLLTEAWKQASKQHRAANLILRGNDCNAGQWRIAKMNAALRNIPIEFGPHPAHAWDQQSSEKSPADCVLAHPSLKPQHWDSTSGQQDWRYGPPPRDNAGFAWLQHLIGCLAPGGIAVAAMSSNSLSSLRYSESSIRRNILDADLVDCIVALSGGMLPGGRFSACLWILRKDRAGASEGARQRHGQTLFIDGSNFKPPRSDTAKEVDQFELARIARTYHSWRNASGSYDDIPGFCRSVSREAIARENDVLLPGRYIGATAPPVVEASEKSLRLMVERLNDQFDESRRLEQLIRNQLQALLND